MKRQANTNPDLLIPEYCSQLLEDIGNRGIKEEGIFRIGGSKAKIDEIQQKVDAGEPFDNTAQINNVSGLFKKFLRELPSPLLTYRMFDTIVGNGSTCYQ